MGSLLCIQFGMELEDKSRNMGCPVAIVFYNRKINKMSSWDWTVPCNCDKCGKIFFPHEKGTWVYKRFSYDHGKEYQHMFCSWSCMRKYDAEYKSPQTRGRKKKEAV